MESPTVRIDLVTTPGCERITYGGSELLGPVIVFATAIAAAAAAITTTLPRVPRRTLRFRIPSPSYSLTSRREFRWGTTPGGSRGREGSVSAL